VKTPVKPPKKSASDPAATQKSPRKVWRFEINVKPGQARPCLRREQRGWILGVREPARDGLANKGVVRALSDYIGVPVSSVSIVRGEGSRIKLIEVSGIDPEEGSRRLEGAATGSGP